MIDVTDDVTDAVTDAVTEDDIETLANKITFQKREKDILCLVTEEQLGLYQFAIDRLFDKDRISRETYSTWTADVASRWRSLLAFQ